MNMKDFIKNCWLKTHQLCWNMFHLWYRFWNKFWNLLNKFWNWIWQWNTARSLLVSLFLFICVPLLIYDFLSDFVKIKGNTEIALNTEIAIIEITELMKGLNSIALAFVALVAAPFAIWRMTLTHRQTKTAEKQADTQLQAHHTENYFKAIEKLDFDPIKPYEEIMIRTGAINGLGKIARESQGHHKQIVELLCSFIRKRANKRFADKQTQENIIDIQTAFDALADRNKEWDDEDLDFDLQNIVLKNLTLRIKNAEGFNFAHANFEGAILQHAHFKEAKLYGTNFNKARLWDANFEVAFLYRANFSGAKLLRANFKGAKLDVACVVKTNLSKTHNLTQRQINVVFGDGATTLPKGFSRPSHWAKTKLGARYRKAWEKWNKERGLE